MAKEYTPAIEDVRDGYRRARYYLDDDAPEDEPYRSGGPEFDRWLAAHDAEVKAEVWDEALHALWELNDPASTIDTASDPGVVTSADVLQTLAANPYRTKEAPHA